MVGAIVKLVLGVVVIGGAVGVVATVVPTPSTCTPDAVATSAKDAQARWDAWAGGSGTSVTFTEGDATAVLRDRLGADTRLVDPVVHFCGDGTAQVSFGFKAGPATLHGVADGTISPTSPLSVKITTVRVGALPSALSDPVVNAVKGVATDAGSLGLAGPVKTVTVTRGQVVVAR